MYDVETRKRALALVGQGRSLNSVSKQTGMSRAAIREWQVRIEPLRRPSECMRCGTHPTAPNPAPYAYLLGLYLGDGCISAQVRGGYTLRIACADAWPGLLAACEGSTRSASSGRWTRRGKDPYNISVARRESVALMDLHVGPKY